MKIAGTQFDRRRKLSLAQRAEIVALYTSGKYSQYALGNMFGVTPQAIRLIVNPSAMKQWAEARERRGGEKRYYNSKYQTKRIREYRKYLKYIEAYVTKQQLNSWSVKNEKILGDVLAAIEAWNVLIKKTRR